MKIAVVVAAVATLCVQMMTPVEAKAITLNSQVVPTWGNVVTSSKKKKVKLRAVKTYISKLEDKDKKAAAALFKRKKDKKAAREVVDKYYQNAWDCLSGYKLSTKVNRAEFDKTMETLSKCVYKVPAVTLNGNTGATLPGDYFEPVVINDGGNDNDDTNEDDNTPETEPEPYVEPVSEPMLDEDEEPQEEPMAPIGLPNPEALEPHGLPQPEPMMEPHYEPIGLPNPEPLEPHGLPQPEPMVEPHYEPVLETEAPPVTYPPPVEEPFYEPIGNPNPEPLEPHGLPQPLPVLEPHYEPSEPIGLPNPEPAPDAYPFSPASRIVPPLWALDLDGSNSIDDNEWEQYLVRLYGLASARANAGSDAIAVQLLHSIIQFHYAMLHQCIVKRLTMGRQYYHEPQQLSGAAYDKVARTIEQQCYVKFRYSLFAGSPPFEWIAKHAPTVTAAQIESWFTRRVNIAKHDLHIKKLMEMTSEQYAALERTVACVYKSLEAAGDSAIDRAAFYTAASEIETCATAPPQ